MLRAQDSAQLNEWTQTLTEQLAAFAGVRDVSNDLQLGGSVTRSIDRTAAARFGLTASDIDEALYDAFGQRQINEIQTEINQYNMILELNTGQRGEAESLGYFCLRSPATGEMVPLRPWRNSTPPRWDLCRSRMTACAPGQHLVLPCTGCGVGRRGEHAECDAWWLGMPVAVVGIFQGAARHSEDSLACQPLVILAALVAVYIILGVLYEASCISDDFSTLPSAAIGAVLLLWVCGHDFSIMALIGLILLIGIVKKNGILMIDFALEAQREGGLSPAAAISKRV